jgi:hypothetical protein
VTAIDYSVEPSLTEGTIRIAQVEDAIAAPLEKFPTGRWWIAFGVAFSLLGFGILTITLMLFKGVAGRVGF